MEVPPMNQVRVAVHAPDRLSLAGLTGYLHPSPGITLTPWSDDHRADVGLVALDRASTMRTFNTLGTRRHPGTPMPLIVIADDLTDDELRIAARNHVTKILPRADLTRDTLVKCINNATTHHSLTPSTPVPAQTPPPKPQPDEHGFQPRELDVLRLLADGLDTLAIAERLHCCERTVKNILAELTARMNLRNRPHAVAHAVRTGAI